MIISIDMEKVQAYLILSCFTLPHFKILLFFVLFFKKLRVCDNPMLNKSISTTFPIAFAHFISVPHSGNSCNISNFFNIIVLVMVIHYQ